MGGGVYMDLIIVVLLPLLLFGVYLLQILPQFGVGMAVTTINICLFCGIVDFKFVGEFHQSNMEDTRDRISQLPEPILHHILSFLLVKDAVRMSTLSKIWTSALNSLSYLDFGEDFFYGPQDMRNLLKAVTQILVIRLKHKISVEKFWLRLPYLRRRFYYVHRWIKLLVACNVKEFDLSVGRRIYEGKQLHNKLPEVIFDAKALNVLNLVGFKIELPSHGTINLSSLRELHLRDVILDEKFIQALCVSCHNLEFLYLAWFKGLASFQVGEKNLPKLKKIKLENCPSEFQMVDIAAISLEDLTIKSYWDLKFVKITACKALKSLFLNGVAVTDKWLEKLFFSLQNLEKFYLSCCNTLTTMKISSIWLKQLIVFGCSNLVDAQVYTPNLILFAFGCCSLPTLKLKASRSLKANISFDSLETPDSDWYNSKLTNFLGSFNHSLSIKLSSKKDEVCPANSLATLLQQDSRVIDFS
ncbi:F-box/FBD/LRR-repeat protein At1g13570-like [Nicotiana tomentosiformis]|uniref:F-box/FBD/LRR-repeat protein At1g13570-like n=1 Tax=Nicotiana tomentosiformis TaxID=4098 RepID=UPI00388C7810